MNVDALITWMNVVTAAVTLIVAVLVVWRARRLGLGYPRLVVVLALFFGMWTIDRLVSPGTPIGYRPFVDALADVAIIVLLAVLIRDASRLTNAIMSTVHEAEYRAVEYERAKRHYAQVVRHRIANPLTVIKGAALTLEAGTVDAALRRELARAIVDSAALIEATSLAPEPAGREEHELDAMPHVGRASV